MTPIVRWDKYIKGGGVICDFRFTIFDWEYGTRKTRITRTGAEGKFKFIFNTKGTKAHKGKALGGKVERRCFWG